LEAGNWGSPNEDGEGDEHDILEDTAEGKDEARGSADLAFLVSVAEREEEIFSLTRKTTETFSANATPALAKKIQRPTE
jgi:hypothetical protein